MTLFKIFLILELTFMPLAIVFTYNKVRDLKLSNARAFQYIAQVKRDLATLIQANTDNHNNLTKQVRCSETLAKQLNNLEDAMRHNRRPSKSKNNAPVKN